MPDVLESQLLNEEMDHLAVDRDGLDELLICLCDAALFEELLGLLVSMRSQATPVLFDPCFHGESCAVEHKVRLDTVHLEGA